MPQMPINRLSSKQPMRLKINPIPISKIPPPITQAQRTPAHLTRPIRLLNLNGVGIGKWLDQAVSPVFMANFETTIVNFTHSAYYQFEAGFFLLGGKENLFFFCYSLIGFIFLTYFQGRLIMKKSTVAVAALLTALSAATVAPAAYANDTAGTQVTGCNGCKGCHGCNGCKGCKGCKGCGGCKGCSGS